MKKIIGGILLAIFVVCGFITPALAQGELLFGQHHAYSVVFRGNGEAIVYARLAVTNSGDSPLTSFSFELPKVEPSEMVIYQVTYPKQCVRYEYLQGNVRNCSEYREPDYSQSYYYGEGTAQYQKISYTKSGTVYTFSLPSTVDIQKGTGIVVAYAAKGYVNESLGRYQFNFETIKVPSRIQDIRVSVDVDSDLLLKGKKSSVNYVDTVRSSASLPTAGVSNAELDRTVRSIGSYGALTKTAKNLAPNESFMVRGEYAKNWFTLYLSSIIITLIIIVGIFVAFYFLGKFLKKRNNSTGGGVSVQTIKHSGNLLSLTTLGTSFLSVLLVIGLSFLLVFLLQSNILYQFSIGPVFGIISFIVIVILYVLAIFGPAIALAVKQGWKSLVIVLIAQLLWFIIFFILYVVFFQSGISSRGNIYNLGVEPQVVY